jgi:hypothetical protein
MSLTSANLVGYLRAEFAKSSRLRVWLFALQLVVVMPAAAAVLIPDHYGDALYWLALISVILLGLWWSVNVRYGRTRGAAQAARRGALLLGGLDQALSPSEIQSLRERFTVNAAEAKACEMSDYYATKLPAGPDRLGEMLEESAFYSEHLQRISANVMLGVLLVFAAICIAFVFGVTPYVARDTWHMVARVFLALFVFAMSADVIGAYLSHRVAASEIKCIRQRLTTADAAGYPLSDVLLAFADYNAAVEGAPESVPYAYETHKDHLNQRWRDYQQDRSKARAARQRGNAP